MNDDINELIRAVESSYEANVFLHIGNMDPNYDDNFMHWIKNCGERKKNALLILHTLGGSADVAYRIARAFQIFYVGSSKESQEKSGGKFIIYVASECKSAGTLLAIGSDLIIMNHESELGPLDVQLRKPDEVGERTSGLAPMQAMNSLRNQAMSHYKELFKALRYDLELSTRISVEVAVSLTTGLLSPIYAQLDPIRMGEIERTMDIASAYGERLSKQSKSLKEGALGRLIADYPSHGFVIDRLEAKELFSNVDEPTPELERLAAIFCSFTRDSFSGVSTPFSMPLKPQGPPQSNQDQGGQDEQQPSKADTGNPGEENPENGPAD